MELIRDWQGDIFFNCILARGIFLFKARDVRFIQGKKDFRGEVDGGFFWGGNEKGLVLFL